MRTNQEEGEDQRKIHAYWDILTNVPESEQCGWLKDRFGISWQSRAIEEMMGNDSKEQVRCVTFLNRQQLDLEALNSV